MFDRDDDTEPASLLTLQVSRLGISQRFYQALFGLRALSEGQTSASVMLTPRSPDQNQFVLRLTTKPTLTALTGLHVELNSDDDLLDLYLLARLRGDDVGRLEVRDDVLRATIFDPDGHRVDFESSTPSPARRRFLREAAEADLFAPDNPRLGCDSGEDEIFSADPAFSEGAPDDEPGELEAGFDRFDRNGQRRARSATTDLRNRFRNRLDAVD